MCTRREKRGFALIELVTVMFITCALIALLLPVLALSAADANGNSCLNNLRQVGWALANFEIGATGVSKGFLRLTSRGEPPGGGRLPTRRRQRGQGNHRF